MPASRPPSFTGIRPAALKTVPVHPAEWTLAVLLAAWLAFLPWAFGTMRVWSQWIALALAAAAFVVALLPRTLPDTSIRVVPARLLVRLPLFWIGLALLAYVAVQALNPAWEWQTDGKSWWLRKLDAISWLPSGIDVPFERMSAWRVLVIWASPFLAGCACWLGITRRRTVQFLVVLFVLNATAVALLGMIQRFTGTNKIYWQFAFQAEVFGSFVYRNHGAAFLLLATAVAIGLAIRHYLHGETHAARSTPAPVFAFIAALLGAAVVVSTSRVGAVFGAGLVVVLLGVFSFRLVRHGLARRTLPVVAAIVIVGFGGWFLSQVDLSRFFARFKALAAESGEASFRMRIAGAEMARTMFADHRLFGIGAGGYRHLEPKYTPDFPILPRETYFGSGGRPHTAHYRMHDAHNDHLQTLAELGLVGGSLAYGALALGLAALTTRQRRFHPLAYSVTAATLTLLLLAAFDFPFLNPAILASLVAIATLACRWADLESPAD